MSLVNFEVNDKWALKLAAVSAGAFLLLTPSAKAQPFPDGSTPKFFICPQGMTRFATLVTTKHDLNLCGQEGGEATLLALRQRGTRKVTTIPLSNSTDTVYKARSGDGTIYTLDTKQKVLSIQLKNNRISREKVVASD